MRRQVWSTWQTRYRLSPWLFTARSLRPFDTTTVPLWVLVAATGGFLLFIIVLLVIVMIRRRRKKKKAAMEQKELDEMLASVGFVVDTASPVGADVMTMQTEKSMELRKDIRQFANDGTPEIAAQMVREVAEGVRLNG